MSFTKFGKFSTSYFQVISLNTFSSALSSPAGTFNMDGSPFVIVPQAPGTVHFFQSVSLLFRLGKFDWSVLMFICSVLSSPLCCWAHLMSYFFWLYFPVLKISIFFSNFYFFAEVSCCFVYFRRICNCLLKHFYEGCFKILAR